MSEPPPGFEPERILAVLARHGVEHVVVGGYAARVAGALRQTRDVDVTPARTAENLERLAGALRELGARVRTESAPEGLAFEVSGESLRGVRMLNLQTVHGEMDLTFHPAAFEGGYEDLVGRSSQRTIGQVQVRVAALEDVIASKASAGRRKDEEALPELRRLAGQATAASFPQPPAAAIDRPPAPLTPAERIAAAAPSGDRC